MVYYRKDYDSRGVFVLSIAICDDNPMFLEEAVSMLSDWPGKPPGMQYTCFTDGDALLKAHSSTPFDLLLIDVVMPLLNGIEAAQELREQDKQVKIVFLTSSPEFAIDSYKVKVSNYLLKPVEKAALHCCLDELWEELQQNARSVLVRSASAVHRLTLNSIEFLEAQNKHTHFFLSDGTDIDSVQPLHTFESSFLLSDGFCKCHRSYIVNLNHIRSYTANEIILRSGRSVRISRSLHKEFEAAYFSAVFGRAGDTQ